MPFAEEETFAHVDPRAPQISQPGFEMRLVTAENAGIALEAFAQAAGLGLRVGGPFAGVLMFRKSLRCPRL